jgi:hypothetical protein
VSLSEQSGKRECRQHYPRRSHLCSKQLINGGNWCDSMADIGPKQA